MIKSVLDFCQFSLRGIDKVRGEWKLVALSYNFKRLYMIIQQQKSEVQTAVAAA